MKSWIYAVIGITVILFGCASSPPKPYWDNSEWVAALGAAVDSSMHYPLLEEAHNGFPSFIATVQFTYISRQLTHIEIIKSTGSDYIDHYIARQIEAVQTAPYAYGSYAPVPHTFQLVINLKPSKNDFYDAIRYDLNKNKHYPTAAWTNKQQGWVMVKFDYRDGSVSNVKIIKSDASEIINEAVIEEFKTINLPQPPISLDLSGKTLHFTIVFCYLLNQGYCKIN